MSSPSKDANEIRDSEVVQKGKNIIARKKHIFFNLIVTSGYSRNTSRPKRYLKIWQLFLVGEVCEVLSVALILRLLLRS